jgi:integrase
MASLTHTKNGTWRAQVEHRGRREYKTFPNKSLASQWAKQREAEIAKGLLISVDEAQRTPLSDVIAEYRKRVLPAKRNRSDKWVLNTLEDVFGDTRLISLTAKDVAGFRDDRLEAGLAPATVVKELNLLRVLVDYAITDLGIYLPANPARIVKNPSVKNSRDRVFLEGEEARLLAAMQLPALVAITQLALETACRLGELLNIELHHIDAQKRTLHIPQTKTDVPRTIPLSSRAVAILKGMPKVKKGERVFACWAAGDSFQNAWKRAVTRARKAYEDECADRKVTPDPRMLQDLRFHDLRHISTSRLARIFPNVIELSRITGHTDLKTLSRYYHVSAADLATRLG